MIIKNGHCLKIYHFSVAHLFFRHNLMLCRNPSFIVWNQSVFAQYNTFVTCYALNKIVEEMMHHAFGQGNKMPLSGFTVQWPLIQTVADKALTFVNYHHLYYHCHLYRKHQHHQPLHHHHHPYHYHQQRHNFHHCHQFSHHYHFTEGSPFQNMLFPNRHCPSGRGDVNACQNGLEHFLSTGLKLFGQCQCRNNTFQKGLP